MAVIVPIVKPLVDVIKQLAASLNETRAYLGLPPVDADAMIEAAFSAQGAMPAAPAMPQPAAPAYQAAPAPQPAPTPAPAPAPAAPAADVPADGTFYFSGVDTNADGNVFDEIDAESGYFKAENRGGTATFTISGDTSKQQELIDVSDFLFDYIAEYTQMPMSAPIIVEAPGVAVYKNGAWVIEKNIRLK